jgi:alpha-beta hydrolase superfamily lysophospholipase
MTLSHAAAMLDAIERTAATPERVGVPMLLLHGADDPMCPAAGSESFHAGLTAPARSLKVYPRLRHEIFNEPERETVFQDVLDWLHERETEGTP